MEWFWVVVGINLLIAVAAIALGIKRREPPPPKWRTELAQLRAEFGESLDAFEKVQDTLSKKNKRVAMREHRGNGNPYAAHAGETPTEHKDRLRRETAAGIIPKPRLPSE